MSQTIQIPAQNRTSLGKNVTALRTEGFIPAIVYGNGFENQSVQVLKSDLLKLGNHPSSSTIFELKMPDGSFQVLLHDYQKHVLSGDFLHIDFLRVNQNKKITAEVPVELTGESPVVKELGGVLVTGIHEVEIRALPADLPERIMVDLSMIKEFNTPIHVRDLALSAKVEVLSSLDAVIASVTRLQSEQETGDGPVSIVPDSVKEEAKVAAPDKEKKGRTN